MEVIASNLSTWLRCTLLLKFVFVDLVYLKHEKPFKDFIKPAYFCLFHMKITASVTKSLHQDCGLCYLHLPDFFLCIHSPLLMENEVVVIAVFLSKLGHRPLFNGMYYETIPVWRLVSIWLTNATHCPL